MILNKVNSVEPTEAQYLIVNALDTLGLLNYEFYNRERGVWFIETPSSVLSLSVILQSGEIYPFDWVQSYENA